MNWLEYNIHISPDFQYKYLFKVLMATLLDLIKPFVETHSDLFKHWHYLIEPDKCRGNLFPEIRIRFQGEQVNLDKTKKELVAKLKDFSAKTNVTIPEEGKNGSHEGCHGKRGKEYKGIESEEDFKQDWPLIVEIFQIGSETALKILSYYPNLRDQKSCGLRKREICLHPNFLHYPANQLLVEVLTIQR